MTAHEMILQTPAGEEYKAYHCPEKDAELQELVNRTWGANCAVAGAYEIAFRSLVENGWQPNPSYLPPNFREEFDRMPSSLSMKKYREDAEFRRLVDLMSNEDARNEPNDPYARLSAEEYMSTAPLVRQQLLTRNEFYRRAVDRLIQSGQI